MSEDRILFRNCPDYDLCEACEASSHTIHPRTHVFLKIKTPVLIGSNKSLLEATLYQLSYAPAVGEKAQKAGDVQASGGEHKKHHRHHHHQPRSDPMAGGYVSRSREELRHEVKQRRKLEKKRASPPEERSKVERTEKEKLHRHKGGHGR